MNSLRIKGVVICFVLYFTVLGVFAKPAFNNTESPEDHTDQPNIFALVENENLHARRTSNIPIMGDGFQSNDTSNRSNVDSTDDGDDQSGVSDDVDDSGSLNNRDDIDGSQEDDINVPRDNSNGTDGNSSESQDDGLNVRDDASTGTDENFSENQDDRLNEQNGSSNETDDGTFVSRDDSEEFQDGNFGNADGEFIGNDRNNTWMVNDNFLAFEEDIIEDLDNRTSVNITGIDGKNDTSILGRRRFRPFRPRPPFRPPPRYRPDGGHRFDSNQDVHAGNYDDFLHAKLDIQAGSKGSFLDANQGVHESGGRWDDRFRSGKGRDSDDDPEWVSDGNKRHGSGHKHSDRFDSSQNVHAGGPGGFLDASQNVHGSKEGGHRDRFDSNQNVNAGGSGGFLDASQNVHGSGQGHRDRFDSNQDEGDEDESFVDTSQNSHTSGHGHRDRIDADQKVHASSGHGHRDRIDASQDVHASGHGHRDRIDASQNVHASGGHGHRDRVDASQNVHASGGHGHRDRVDASQNVHASGGHGHRDRVDASQNVHASGGHGDRDRVDASQNVHASGGHGHRDRIDASQNVHASSGHGGRFDASQNIHAGGSRDRNQYGHTPYGKYLSNSMNVLVAQSISIGGRRRTQIAISGPALDFLTVVLKSLVDIADHVGEKCFSLLVCLIGANEDDRLNNLGLAVSTFHRMVIPLQRVTNGTSSVPYMLGVSSKSESTCEKNYTGCDQIQKYIKSFLK